MTTMTTKAATAAAAVLRSNMTRMTSVLNWMKMKMKMIFAMISWIICVVTMRIIAAATTTTMRTARTVTKVAAVSNSKTRED